MVTFIDTHVHLDFFDDPAAECAAAVDAGIEELVVPGVAPGDWPRLFSIAEDIRGVWAAPGIHPQEAVPWTESLETEFRAVLRHARTAAIGEVGLDKQATPTMAVQEEMFRHMIALAREHGLPLLLHVRRATGRVLDLLADEKADQVGGIWHAFSGSPETAERLFDLGFAIGVGGIVTFPEAKQLPEVVRRAPADRLVLETDAPDLTPHPHRGRRNRPAHLPLIAERVARLRDWDLAETAAITSRNARRILKLS